MTATAQWLEQDYYRVLGVREDASDKEITKAYRRLARQLHPDTNPDGDSDRFKDVSTAYDVLHDPVKRREYDELRRLASRTRTTPGSASPGGYTIRADHAGNGGSAFGDVDVEDLLSSMFGGQARPRPRRSRRGRDVAAELHLTFEEAVRGTTTDVPVLEQQVCPSCGGSGLQSAGGSGPCAGCGGHGLQQARRSVRARIPAGVQDGQTVRLNGRGEPGEGGGESGDLVVQVHVQPHRLFGRRGRDLTLTVPVTFPEAALGADIRVPTLDVPVTVRVPAGTPTGRTLRVRGRGVQTGKGTGDLLVTVEVAVPERLTAEQRAAVEALAAATTGSPRASLGV